MLSARKPLISCSSSSQNSECRHHQMSILFDVIRHIYVLIQLDVFILPKKYTVLKQCKKCPEMLRTDQGRVHNLPHNKTKVIKTPRDPSYEKLTLSYTLYIALWIRWIGWIVCWRRWIS